MDGWLPAFSWALAFPLLFSWALFFSPLSPPSHLLPFLLLEAVSSRKKKRLRKQREQSTITWPLCSKGNWSIHVLSIATFSLISAMEPSKVSEGIRHAYPPRQAWWAPRSVAMCMSLILDVSGGHGEKIRPGSPTMSVQLIGYILWNQTYLYYSNELKIEIKL